MTKVEIEISICYSQSAVSDPIKKYFEKLDMDNFDNKIILSECKPKKTRKSKEKELCHV